METKMELFEHELRDIYFAEKKLVTALGELARETDEGSLKDAFLNHQQETMEHVNRLEEVFATIGLKPKGKTCEGIMGLIKEKKSIRKEKPTQTILNLFNTSAAIKTEHYEICAYESLIKLAEELNYREARNLLQKNLDEENNALNTLKRM